MTRRRALAALAAMPVWGRPRPPFERTFLQPWRVHLAWSEAQWTELVDWLRALAVREVALQWCSWNGVDYFEIAARLAPLLAARGMKLRLGLAFDEDFWRWPVRPGPDLPLLLEASRQRSVALAARLAAGPARFKSFSGWYLPEEFDAARWGSVPKLVAAHLSASRSALRAIRRAPVAVSGFPSATSDESARFWTLAVSTGAVDELWMQDGIGAGKTTLDAWPAWCGHLAAALRPTRCRLSVIVETFETISVPGFTARPAPIERILRQISTAQRVTRRPLTAFSIPDYTFPPAGSAGLRLARDYAAAFGLRPAADLPSNLDQSLR